MLRYFKSQLIFGLESVHRKTKFHTFYGLQFKQLFPWKTIQIFIKTIAIVKKNVFFILKERKFNTNWLDWKKNLCQSSWALSVVRQFPSLEEESNLTVFNFPYFCDAKKTERILAALAVGQGYILRLPTQTSWQIFINPSDLLDPPSLGLSPIFLTLVCSRVEL